MKEHFPNSSIIRENTGIGYPTIKKVTKLLNIRSNIEAENICIEDVRESILSLIDYMLDGFDYRDREAIMEYYND